MISRILIGLMVVMFVSGCATTKNYSGEVDALNARVSSLQKQIEAKDREIAALSDQNRSLQGKLEAANKARLEAERRLDKALARLSSSQRSSSGYDKASTGSYVK